MNLIKYTQTINIEDFNKQINEICYVKYFTTNEISTFGQRRKKGSLAARYLIKKIIIKHFSNKLEFTDIEIMNNDLGKPILHFLKPINTNAIHFSLSHSKSTVAVLVIFENNES